MFLLEKEKVTGELNSKVVLCTFLLDRNMLYNNNINYKYIEFLKNISFIKWFSLQVEINTLYLNTRILLWRISKHIMWDYLIIDIF